MARLNIEDGLFTDPRFLRLCVELKSEIKAIGWWVKVARLAQSFWKINKQLIPESAYLFGKFPDALISAGIIEKTKNGYYLIGSERNFAWIFSQTENGKKGGRPRQVVDINEDMETHGLTHDKPTRNLPTPTPTPTPTHNKNTHTSSETTSEYLSVVEIWNNIYAPKYHMPKIKTNGSLWGKRVKKLKQVCKDVTVEQWHIIFQSLKDKRFIRSDGSVFIPDFDYIFRFDRWAKILEEYTCLAELEEEPEDFPDSIESHCINPEDYFAGMK